MLKFNIFSDSYLTSLSKIPKNKLFNNPKNKIRGKTMMIFTRFLLVTFFLLSASSYLIAQEGSGQIHGVVSDSITGDPLFGANVWLKGYTGQMRLGDVTAEGAGHRQRVEDVAQGGELYDRDLHRGPPKARMIVWIRSRVEWLFASPAIATAPPAASTEARSGTVSSV